MKTFNVGDRVKVTSNESQFFDHYGIVQEENTGSFRVQLETPDGRLWFFSPDQIQLAPPMEDTQPIELPKYEVVPERPSNGTKHDDGKPDFALLSVIWLLGVVRVMTKGKLKYSAHNWRKGIQISRLVAAVLRHVFLFLAGIDYDVNPKCSDCQKGNCKKHTGEHHLYCASCGLMFISEMVVTRPDLDDRYKLPEAAQQSLIDSMEDQITQESI